MFEIAICDNDEKDLIQLHDQVTEYLENNQEINGNVESFLSSVELKKRLTEKHFHIFVLDIMMPGINGIELGKIIRGKDEPAVIIYTTSSREFAFDAYGIHALRYLEKPISAGELREAIASGIQIIRNAEVQKISVNTKTGLVTVRADDIIYIENVSRCAVYVLKDGTDIVSTYNRRTFENSIRPLNEHPDFLQPHKSFFVNMGYIQAMQGDTLLLDNGKQIFISRNRVSAAKKRYLKYLSQKGARV